MKKLSLIAAFVMMALSGFSQEKQAKQEKFEEVKILTSAVCDMCKRTMEKNLVFEKGIREVSLDVPSKILTVEYRVGKTDVEKIKKAINKLGYDADDKMASQEQYDTLHSCCRKDSH